MEELLHASQSTMSDVSSQDQPDNVHKQGNDETQEAMTNNKTVKHTQVKPLVKGNKNVSANITGNAEEVNNTCGGIGSVVSDELPGTTQRCTGTRNKSDYLRWSNTPSNSPLRLPINLFNRPSEHLKCQPVNEEKLRQRIRHTSVELVHVKLPLDQPSHSTVCTRKLRPEQQLQDHLKVHTERKNFTCTVCSKCFHSIAKLQKHSPAHKAKTVVCHICDQSFVSNDRLRIHIFSHCNKNPPECALCRKRFRERRELKCHIMMHFGKILRYKCKCGERFPTKYALERHVRLCRRLNDFPCHTCVRFFLTSVQLKKHCRVHLQLVKEKQPYHCPECDEVLNAGFSTIQFHVLIKHRVGSTRKAFACDECGLLVLPENRRQHVKTHLREMLKTSQRDC